MKIRGGAFRPGTVALAVILFFVFDRALSVGYLLPEFCIEDERWVQEAAVRMVQKGTLDPGTRKYPGLMFTLTAGVYYGAYLAANARALSHFESPESAAWHRAHYSFSFSSTIIFGRLLVIALAAAGLGLFYVFARREVGWNAALPALFFLATSPGFLFITLILKNDVLIILGTLAVVMTSLRILSRGEKMDYLWAGAALGFCLAAKYHLPAVVPLLAAHRLRHSSLSLLQAFKKTRWLLIIPSAVAVSFLLSPWTWLDLKGTIQQGITEWALQNQFAPLLRRTPGLWWHWPILFQFTAVLPFLLGLPLYLLSLAGLGLKLDVHNPRQLVIFSYPAGLLAWMIALSELGVPHLYAPAAPFFALAAGLVVASWFGSKGRGRRAAATAVAGFIAGYNLLLFHTFIAVEDRFIREPVRELMNSSRSGGGDIALVPYFPNPEMDWTISFYPQFLLSKEALARENPDRLLLHHTFYRALLHHPEVASSAAGLRMTPAYVELCAGQLGYQEEKRWTGIPPLLSFYARLFPELQFLETSIFRRQGKTPATEDNTSFPSSPSAPSTGSP